MSLHSCLFSEGRRKATHFMIKFKTTPVNKVFMSFFHVVMNINTQTEVKNISDFKILSNLLTKSSFQEFWHFNGT